MTSTSVQNINDEKEYLSAFLSYIAEGFPFRQVLSGIRALIIVGLPLPQDLIDHLVHSSWIVKHQLLVTLGGDKKRTAQMAGYQAHLLNNGGIFITLFRL